MLDVSLLLLHVRPVGRLNSNRRPSHYVRLPTTTGHRTDKPMSAARSDFAL